MGYDARYHAEYYQANRERILAYKRRWRATKLAEIKERERQYRQTHAQKIATRKHAWTEANRERLRTYWRRWHDRDREELRRLVFTHYSGAQPKCACCGETEIRFLTVDHVNGGGNRHRQKVMGDARRAGRAFYRWLVANSYPEGFQILCFNCNFAKGHYNCCPHETSRRLID